MGSGVWVFKRGKKVAALERPVTSSESIKALLVFGPWIVATCSTTIEVWKSAAYEHYTTLTPTPSRKNGGAQDFRGPTCSMPTYLNKIFVARQDGDVEIWNLSTGKLIYNILPPTANAGAVTALQPAPVLSLLAIAYESGPVIIHDIRSDTTLIKVNPHSSRSGRVSSISFRTDGLGAGDDGRKSGVMATSGDDSGDVTFWDLNDGGRIMGVLRGAHYPPSSRFRAIGGGINKAEFLPGQPVVVTSGLDNSLKSWIFDETPFSSIPRILHSRSGHAGPVSRLGFLPANADGSDATGKWLLSAGQDRSLWGWSLRRDGQSTELSQGNVRKKARKWGLLGSDEIHDGSSTKLEDLKAPMITCMASSLNRDGGVGAAAGAKTIWTNTRAGHGKRAATDANSSSTTGWESVITGHEGDKLARTWFWGRKRAGRWAFETGDEGVVTVCRHDIYFELLLTLSVECGHYAMRHLCPCWIITWWYRHVQPSVRPASSTIPGHPNTCSSTESEAQVSQWRDIGGESRTRQWLWPWRGETFQRCDRVDGRWHEQDSYQLWPGWKGQVLGFFNWSPSDRDRLVPRDLYQWFSASSTKRSRRIKLRQSIYTSRRP